MSRGIIVTIFFFMMTTLIMQSIPVFNNTTDSNSTDIQVKMEGGDSSVDLYMLSSHCHDNFILAADIELVGTDAVICISYPKQKLLMGSGDELKESLGAGTYHLEYTFKVLSGDKWDIYYDLISNRELVASDCVWIQCSKTGLEVVPPGPPTGELPLEVVSNVSTDIQISSERTIGTLVAIFQYTDVNNIVPTPCRFCQVDLLLDLPLVDWPLAVLYTDEWGFVCFQNVDLTNKMALRIWADDGIAVEVVNEETGSDENVYSWKSPSSYFPPGNSYLFNITDWYRGVFSAMFDARQACNFMLGEVGWKPPKIQIEYPYQDWPHAHLTEIDVPNNGAIWSHRTIYHEYGHVVFYNAINPLGLFGFWGAIEGPDPHMIYCESNRAFALSEGWAEFFECAVGTWLYGYIPDWAKWVENGQMSNGVPLTEYIDAGDFDGAIIEGAVAQVLFDIWDGIDPNDYSGWDVIEYGDYVNHQFGLLWNTLRLYGPSSIVMFYDLLPHNPDWWAVFYHARMNEDHVMPINPSYIVSSPDVSSVSSPISIAVTLNGASDDVSGIGGYYYSWSMTPEDPTFKDHTHQPYIFSPWLSEGVWYLNVRVFDRASNMPIRFDYFGVHNDYATFGPWNICRTTPPAPTACCGSFYWKATVLLWEAVVGHCDQPILEYRVYRGLASGYETFLSTAPNPVWNGYLDLTANEDIDYYYKVSAVTEAGESLLSNEVVIRPYFGPWIPGEVMNVTYYPGEQSLTLMWDPPLSDNGAPILEYLVSIQTNVWQSGSEHLEYVVPVNEHMLLEITGIDNGWCQFYIRARNAMGLGYYKAPLYAIEIGPSPPAPVTKLKAKVDYSSIALKWIAPIADGGDEDIKYNVTVSRFREFDIVYQTQVSDEGVDIEQFGFSIRPGWRYFVSVTAINSYGSSAPSNITIAIPRQPATPSVPNEYSATNAKSKVVLTWSAPYDGERPILAYSIYRGQFAGNISLFAQVNGTTLSYNDTSAVVGTTYLYQVSARNTIGEGSRTPVFTGISQGLPSAPLNVTVIAGNHVIWVSWLPPQYRGEGNITYHVYRSGIETWSGTEYTYQDTAVSNGFSYSYYVVASTQDGMGGTSSTMQAIPIDPYLVPNPPTDLIASRIGPNIILNWSLSLPNGAKPAEQYLVFRSINPGAYGLSPIAILNNATNYTDTTCMQGIQYYYVVRAHNPAGNSSTSNEAFGIVPIPAAPGAPSELHVSVGKDNVTLTWSEPSNQGSEHVSGYCIYRGEGQGEMSLLANLSGTCRYVDENVEPGHTYRYIVKANNSVGTGEASVEAQASVPGGDVNPIIIAIAVLAVTAALIGGYLVLARKRR